MSLDHINHYEPTETKETVSKDVLELTKNKLSELEASIIESNKAVETIEEVYDQHDIILSLESIGVHLPESFIETDGKEILQEMRNNLDTIMDYLLVDTLGTDRSLLDSLNTNETKAALLHHILVKQTIYKIGTGTVLIGSEYRAGSNTVDMMFQSRGNTKESITKQEKNIDTKNTSGSINGLIFSQLEQELQLSFKPTTQQKNLDKLNSSNELPRQEKLTAGNLKKALVSDLDTINPIFTDRKIKESIDRYKSVHIVSDDLASETAHFMEGKMDNMSGIMSFVLPGFTEDIEVKLQKSTSIENFVDNMGGIDEGFFGDIMRYFLRFAESFLMSRGDFKAMMGDVLEEMGMGNLKSETQLNLKKYHQKEDIKHITKLEFNKDNIPDSLPLYDKLQNETNADTLKKSINVDRLYTALSERYNGFIQYDPQRLETIYKTEGTFKFKSIITTKSKTVNGTEQKVYVINKSVANLSENEDLKKELFGLHVKHSVKQLGSESTDLQNTIDSSDSMAGYLIGKYVQGRNEYVKLFNSEYLIKGGLVNLNEQKKNIDKEFKFPNLHEIKKLKPIKGSKENNE